MFSRQSSGARIRAIAGVSRCVHIDLAGIGVKHIQKEI